MPKARLIVRAPTSKAEMNRFADLIFQSFAGFNQPHEATVRWLNHIGRENLRIGILDRQIVAGLGILDFGQYFGGQAIRAAGITCVGVAPEVRGVGIAGEFMRSVMKELADAEFPLSVLYPSTYGLYRKAGFEPAGIRARFQLDISSLGIRNRSRPIVPLKAAKADRIRELYNRLAPHYPGKIARTEREWRRILQMGVQPVYLYGVPESGGGNGLDGYIVYHQSGADRAPYEIHIRDAHAANRDAAERILAFLGDHGTMAGTAYYESGHADPLLSTAREEWVKIADRILWMLRVLNVPHALAARGYSRHIRGEIEMEIEDDLIPENAKRFVLSVSGGAVRVREGGNGALHVEIRGLAPLLSGHMSAEQIQTMGLLDGPAEVLAAASGVFAGPAPGMNERF